VVLAGDGGDHAVTVAKAKSGQALKLTPDRADEIIAALRSGVYAKVAAASAGIAESTYYAWLERGREEAARVDGGGKARPTEAPFLDLCRRVTVVQAEAEVASLARIRKAGQDGTWQADAWYLERVHFDRYGRFERRSVEVSGAPAGAPIRLSVEDERERREEDERILVEVGALAVADDGDGDGQG